MNISFFTKAKYKENYCMSKQTQKGFAVVEATLIVVVLVLLGGVGYWVVSKNKPASQAANQTTVETKKAVETAKAPTAAVELTLTQAVETEDAAEDSGATEVEKKIDSAVDSAATVGDSFNENDL
jgi:cytoskeletal protein RodZ